MSYLHTADYVVIGIYLLATLGLGAWFSRTQKTTKDFFLAGQRMHWMPVALSLVVTVISALSFTGIPAMTYQVGLLMLGMIAACWLALPIIIWVALPFYYNLRLYSAYEYLEKRFNLAVRMASSMIWVIWRLLWLGGVLYAPCKALLFAVGIDETENREAVYAMLIGLGALTTAYTFLGGMKAVIWTDAAQFCVIMVGIIMVVGIAVFGPQGAGLTRSWEMATEHGLTQITHLEFNWSDNWAIWGFGPHMFLAVLSFSIADQITLQRMLTTPNLAASKRSVVAGTISNTCMLMLLILVGMSLFVFYHGNPDKYQDLVRAAPNEALAPILAGNPDHDLSALVATTQNPDIDTNLALPYFIVTELPVGLAGMIVAALFAASMSSMDSGLNSLSTSMIVDFHRRLGWGRQWMARRYHKTPADLNESDELFLGRALTLGMGVLATSMAIVVSHIEDIWTIMTTMVNTAGGPLLVVFLLGMLSRRIGPRGALFGLVFGVLFTVWITFAANIAASTGWTWLWPFKFDAIWNLTFGVCFTIVVAYVVSFLFDPKPDRMHLEGLVVGVGKPGQTMETA